MLEAMKAISEGSRRFEGHMAFGMWFMELLKRAGAGRILGPEVAMNTRIRPVLMNCGSPQEGATEVRSLIDQGAPLENFAVDTVGLTYGPPDENVRAARRTAAECGKIERRRPSKAEPF